MKRKTYAWTDRKTGQLYARVRVPQGNGKYKTVYRRAESVEMAGRLAREMMLELVFAEVRELTFDDFKERINKIYEH